MSLSSHTETAETSRFLQARAPSFARDVVMLTKPEITFLVVLSALAGFVLGADAPGATGWSLAATLVGVGLTSAGGAILNHLFEKDFDATMHRTASRPLPTGRITETQARWMGYGSVCAGVGLICPTVNPLTAGLAILTVVLYLYVYTPLKRVTVWNTLIGTIPGALPALGGYAAATNTLGAPGWALFLVLVAWQMPHFLSLSWMYRKDYARGGFQMSASTDESGTTTGLLMLFFTLLLTGASLLLVWMGLASWLYGGAALALGAYLLRPVVAFLRGERTAPQAKRVLKASVLYIPALVAALIVDALL